MRLQDKVAIISGAASGMGAATARRFAKEGQVVVADMLEDDGRKVAADITLGTGGRVHATGRHDEASWQSWWRDGGEIWPVGHLVNNAGISGSAVTDMLDTDAWDG